MKYKNNFSESNVSKFWDGIAKHYIDENEKVDETHNQRFVEALKHFKFKKGMKVLNIWSRDGGLIPYIRKKYPHIELINYELSPKMYNISKKLYPNETFIQGSLLKFQFDDNQFDAIISLETLEHVSEPLKFLRECHRVLKNKGQFIMSLPPATVEYTSIAVNILKFHHGEGPHKFLNSGKVKKFLKMTGFKLLKHKGTVFFYLGPKFLEKITPQFIKNIFGIRQFYISEPIKEVNPRRLGELCTYCGTCYSIQTDVCPGWKFDFEYYNNKLFGKVSNSFLGNYKSIYVGYSKNLIKRKEGASGGVVTQILYNLFDKNMIDNALVVKFSESSPWIPKPVIINNKEMLKGSSQSKYTIAPVNSLIKKIKETPGRYAVVALSCQVHALRMMQEKDKVLAKRIKYIIGLYCGNTLLPESTLSIFRRFKVNPKSVLKLRFREGKWPGDFFVKTKKNKEIRINKFTWNYLIPFYINPGCLYCTDLTNEFSDISVGDGWHLNNSQKGLGRSVIISRTKKGDEILKSNNISLQRISEKDALLMHSHAFDFKRIGSYLRIENRKRKGKTFPIYNQKSLKIGISRRIKEKLIIFIFFLGQLKISRKIIELIPLSIIGIIFKKTRSSWQKNTDHIGK